MDTANSVVKRVWGVEVGKEGKVGDICNSVNQKIVGHLSHQLNQPFSVIIKKKLNIRKYFRVI